MSAMTPSDLSALIASVREAEAKMTPGRMIVVTGWRSDCDGKPEPCDDICTTNGGALRTAFTTVGERHDDAAGIALLRNSAKPLCDAIEELQRELEARNRDLDALQKHLASLNQPTL